MTDVPDPLKQKTDDWEIAGAGGLAEVVKGGGGIFLYVFRSAKLSVCELVYLCAAGIGAGGNQSGIGTDSLITKDLSYSKAGVINPFALGDIHKTFGRVTTVAADPGMLPLGAVAKAAVLGAATTAVLKTAQTYLKKLPLSYGRTTITAWSGVNYTYFQQTTKGWSVGSGGGAFCLVGMWYSQTLNGNSVNPFHGVVDAVENAIEAYIGQADMEIRRLNGDPRFR